VAHYREHRVTATDGLSLFVRDYGDPLAARTPVLCLSGVARTSRDFGDLAPRLAADRRVICPDYRGRGQSDYDTDWRNYHPRIYIRDILDILTALDVHRVVVIGTSLGGLLAMALAVARPGVLAALVLNDVGPEINLSGVSRIVDYMKANARQPDWDSAVRILKQNYRHDGITSDDQWRKLAGRTYAEGHDGVLRYDFDLAIVRGLERGSDTLPTHWPVFRALAKVPVLALRGALSDVLTEAVFDRMAREKTDLIRVTIPGVGHVPLLDEPESERAIDDLLQRH
jgi:pimeloyl-ACP methyl ester carboxylesterase